MILAWVWAFKKKQEVYADFCNQGLKHFTMFTISRYYTR